MMIAPLPSAYIFIEVKPGSDECVLNEVSRVRGVSEAHMTMGSYDIIAVVENSSKDDVKLLVSDIIRRIKDVRHTYTLPVIH